MDWNDLHLVLAICRTGTLSGAARALGVNHSTVFRRINAIEKSLSVRLFDRQPAGYAMTEAGEAVRRTAEQMDEQVDSLTRELLGRDLQLQGPLKLTSPEGIALKFLAPELSAFCKQHPGIQMDLIISSDALRLSRREADIAIRVTRRSPEANLIGRRICKFRFAMYAATGYVQQNPDRALEEHSWLVVDDGFEQLPKSLWKQADRGTAQIVFSSNNLMATLQAIKDGLGVAPLPCFLGDTESDLVRLTEPVEDLTMDLWILTHQDLRNTARVGALMNSLVGVLQQQKSWFEGAGLEQGIELNR